MLRVSFRLQFPVGLHSWRLSLHYLSPSDFLQFYSLKVSVHRENVDVSTAFSIHLSERNTINNMNEQGKSLGLLLLCIAKEDPPKCNHDQVHSPHVKSNVISLRNHFRFDRFVRLFIIQADIALHHKKTRFARSLFQHSQFPN